MLDTIDLLDVQTRREKYPDEAGRVEEILELLDDLRAGKDKARVAASLTRALSHYQWRHQVSPTAQGLRVIAFAADRKLPPGEKWEYGRVSYLLALMPYPGQWPRRCADAACREWFAPQRRGRRQMFCTEKCKQRTHEQDSAKREKKNKRMQQQYAVKTKRARTIIWEHRDKSAPDLLKLLERFGMKRSGKWVAKELAVARGK